VLLIILMHTSSAPRPQSFVFIAVIFVAILIDAVLLAQVRVNFLRDHGYDVSPRYPAIPRPAPP
jgi:hypothetical protein